jgi:ribulose bisphosphate carboxylase small subunit
MAKGLFGSSGMRLDKWCVMLLRATGIWSMSRREHFSAATEDEARAMAQSFVDRHPGCYVDTIPLGPVAPMWTVGVEYEDTPRPN